MSGTREITIDELAAALPSAAAVVIDVREPHELGEDGQKKLLASKVLCVGAGGLGSPASLYLAAAGVGTLGLVDDDVVDASNLQRQVVHTTDRVGVPKVESAAQTLTALNPD